MSSTVLLNSTNVVNNGNGNKLVYTFNNPKTFKNNTISLASVDLFYSWYNISAKYGNNSLQYSWLNSTGNGYSTFNINIPDGFYTIPQLNVFIQSVFISNKHYLINTVSNAKIFLLECVENSNYYKIQLNSYAVDSAYLTAQTWSVPSGSSWIVTNLTLMPQFVINSNSFRDIIGFTAGSYPVLNSPTTGIKYSSVSLYCPQVSPVNSLIMRCNLISNIYTNPSDILTSFHINASFGSVISYQPSTSNPIKIQDSIYSSIEITICDQNFNDISIIDPSMVVRLLIE